MTEVATAIVGHCKAKLAEAGIGADERDVTSSTRSTSMQGITGATLRGDPGWGLLRELPSEE